MLWAEAAHWLGIVPLLVVAWMAITNQSPSARLWLLASAFGVSWVADTAAHWVAPWVVSLVYPVSQAGIIGLALLEPRRSDVLLSVLLITATIAVLWHGAEGPDVFLRTVAWLSVAGIARGCLELGSFRTALLVAFGLGWLAWIAHALWINLHPFMHGAAPTWFVMQSVRALGIGLFCYAAVTAEPRRRFA